MTPAPSRLRRVIGGAGSLQRRLLLAAGVFLGIALVAAGLSIGFILHRFVRGQIDGRLDDRIQALAADLVPGPDGRLHLGRDRDGPPFDRPRSGWYWQVRRGDTVLRSASLDARDLALPGALRDRAETDRPAPAEGVGPWGEALVLRILTVPGPEGATVFAASAPAAALRGPVIEALRTLAICLAVIGAFLFAGVVLQIRLGLLPLQRLRGELAAIRAGRAARLSAAQPTEVAPLAAEMNALLDQNARNLEHARTHVANLAHGLKTPLATLSMALRDREADPDGGLVRLVEAMDARVRHHLRRARAAAIGGPARTRADLAAHADDLRGALLRLHADRAIDITVTVPAGLAVACDPQDLDEMLGNLIENACRWCRSRVRVSARAESAETVVLIEDDGPGLDAAAVAEVVRRGRRLDESLPGHGFGLPIAIELAELYGGALSLDRSDLGGLRVRLTLPA